MTVVYCNNEICEFCDGGKCSSTYVDLSNVGMPKVFHFDCDTYKKKHSPQQGVECAKTGSVPN